MKRISNLRAGDLILGSMCRRLANSVLDFVYSRIKASKFESLILL